MTKRPLPTQLKLSSARLVLAAAALLFVAQWTQRAEGQEPSSAGAELPAVEEPQVEESKAEEPKAEEPQQEDGRRPDWDKSPAQAQLDALATALTTQRLSDVYEGAHEGLKVTHSLESFGDQLTGDRLIDATAFKVTSGVTQEDGYRLDGVATLKDKSEVPFYAILRGPQSDFNDLKLYDVQSTESFMTRLRAGNSSTLDTMALLVFLALFGSFLWIILNYVRGLAGSPREIYLLFFTKVTEYSAYGAANMAFVLYLSRDLGLSDVGAGSYIGAWSMGLTVLTMLVGAICDAIGIKATLLLGCYALLISRGLMPFLSDIYTVTLFGFVPLAFGIAVTGPVLSVGVKRFTTKSGAALGFGLFYTLMNVGWALGAQIFDSVRGWMGEQGTLTVLGSELSTYQVIIGLGFLLTLPDLLAIIFMRHNVERTEEGVVIHPHKKAEGVGFMERFSSSFKKGSTDTIIVIKEVFTQKAFWIFIGLIGVTVFVRLTFYHFHYTFPKYGIRLFGEGVKIGSIFGVLNPILIIFLVPLIASLTTKVRSYWMLLIGSVISTASVFFVIIDPEVFAPLANTWFGELIFDWWLEVPHPDRIPFYMSLVIFILIFTIGEAIWSPRLMQFTAEIAPKGKEGSYIALSALPGFLSKFIAGPMSGWLVATYTPEGASSYPEHYMVWVWIGGMAMLSPIGLVVFRAAYRAAEERAQAEELEMEKSEG